MRLTLLDGFRGYFLLFMTIVHANSYLNTFIGKLNHHYIGWVEDAQGFVFISGFVVGLVYTKRLIRKGEQAMTGAVGARMFHIWRYHAALALLFLALAFVLPHLGYATGILSAQRQEPLLFTLAELGLLGSTLHMGILPMYLVFMTATPFALRAFHGGRAVTVAALSVLAWLFAQTGLPDQAQLPVEHALKAAGHPINIGIYFNIFAWQALYMGGLWLGYLMANDRLNLSFLRAPQAETIFHVALTGFVLLALFDVVVYTQAFGLDYSRLIWRKIDRGNLDALYVIAFAIDLYIVAWLANAGAESRHRATRAAAAGLRWLFSRRALVFLGQHALQVFVTQVVVVYAIAIWVEGRKPDALEANLLLLATIPPLYLAAWVHRWAKSRPVKPRIAVVAAE